MHVLVAHQKAEQSSFKEFHALKGRKGAKLLDHAGDFLHRRIVLGFAALATELRKILDRQAIAALPVKTLDKVRERTVNRAEQAMDRRLNANGGGHSHGQAPVFREFRISPASRLQYLPPPRIPSCAAPRRIPH